MDSGVGPESSTRETKRMRQFMVGLQQNGLAGTREYAVLLRYLSLVSMFVILIGCAKQKGTEYFPETSASSRYEYSLEYQTPLGGVQKASVTTRVDGQEAIRGQQYHKLVSTFFGVPGLDQRVVFERWTATGVYAVDGDHKDSAEYLDTPFPVSIGSTWTSRAPDHTDTYKVLGVETVETPHETFKDCLKLSANGTGTNGSSEGTEYLAPNIGLVKLVTVASGVRMTLTLEKYKK
jgi:hypothetical protein